MSRVATKIECPLIKELSNCLKENSRSGIVSCLTRIKMDEKSSQRFLENGGIPLLVELLRYRNTKVMDVTLSILANGCLLSHVREKVEGTKIASYVVWIVKNLQSGDTMHCRACRLMGNLSESNSHAKALCEAGAVIALTDILRSKANAQTLGMAVRAVRIIWTTNKAGREEILEAGTIKEITSLLVRSRKKMIERENDTKHGDLAETCLKAMQAFADETDPRSGDQMRGDKGVHGYRCIVDYCRSNNKTAIKCLYKLCRYPGRRPDLGNSGAIECLVDNLKSGGLLEQRSGSMDRKYTPILLSTSFGESLVCLCLFCREAVNRAKIRRGSGLETILAVLNEVKNEKYHPMLLHALAQFICDDLSIDIMVKNGLIEVLVDKLKKMSNDSRISDKNKEAERKNGKKRSADKSPLSRGCDLKYNRTDYKCGRFSLDFPCDDWSPGSMSTAYSSPSNTPPLTSYDTNSDIDENADDNYSPICSDNEWLENEDTNDIQYAGEPNEKNQTVGNRDEDNEDGNDFREEDKNDNSDEKYQVVDEEDEGGLSTLALLSMLSHSSVPIDGLADSTTIRALTDYIASSKNHRACVILTRILRNRAYFVPLLLQGFIFEAQTLHGTELYTRALSEIAETGGAFGEIATLLLRGKNCQKSMVAISIPYVIKNREKLRILLNNHGGLELIYRVLCEPNNTMHDDAIVAISKLADSLNIEKPKNRLEPFDGMTQTIVHNNIIDEFAEEDKKEISTVVFELDDGSHVETKRKIICEKSEVFAAMLKGNFCESGKSRVRLKKASKDGLSSLLSAVSGNSDFSSHRIEALFDAVILADKFLMSELSEHLTRVSIARLSHENLCRAWSWSRVNSCHEFRHCCVKLFLTSTMTRNHRLRIFHDFADSMHFREFVKDTRDIIDNSLALSQI